MLPRLLAVAAVVFAVAPAASAAPPVVTEAGHLYGKPSVSWSLTPGATSDLLQITKTPPPTPGFWAGVDFHPLDPGQKTWRWGDRFVPGTYSVHVSSVTPAPPCDPNADECPVDLTEWSNVAKLTIPKPPGIVPGKGMDYVRLGMTTAQVRQILGRETSLDGTLRSPILEYYGIELRVLTKARRVSRFELFGRKLRVEGTNVGVGSSERQLRAALRGARCLTWRNTHGKPFRYCWLGAKARGRVITYFELKRGRVANMKIGRVVHARHDPFFGIRF